MAQGSSDRGPDSGEQLWLSGDAFRVVEQAERVRQQVRAAQRVTAHQLNTSADSHDRTARSYEDLAKHAAHRDRRDVYLQHAARHRKFAEEDRRMAAQLRQMGESGDGKALAARVVPTLDAADAAASDGAGPGS